MIVIPIFVWVLSILIIVSVSIIIIYKEMNSHREEMNKQQEIAQKTKGGSGKFEGWIDNAPFALDQLQILYNEQKEAGATDEQLKPLLERIKLLNTVVKYEPLARVGARFGDMGVKMLEGWMKKGGIE